MSLLDDDLQTLPPDSDDAPRPDGEPDALPSWAGTAIDFAAFWPVDSRARDITIDLTGEQSPAHAHDDAAVRDGVTLTGLAAGAPPTVEAARARPVEPAEALDTTEPTEVPGTTAEVDATALAETTETADADATPAASRRTANAVRRSTPPTPRGLRIRRVRLTSLAAVAGVFFTLLYLVLVGTSVALWNAGVNLGLVDGLENLITTSLGVESFEVAGPALFELVLVGAGVVCAFGLLVTVLLGLVYNATGALFGGLAVETGPLRRRGKTFTLLTSS